MSVRGDEPQAFTDAWPGTDRACQACYSGEARFLPRVPTTPSWRPQLWDRAVGLVSIGP